MILRLLALLCISVVPVQAGTFVVNSTANDLDANPGDGICASSKGECTLRAAMEEAYYAPGSTVIVPAGTYQMDLSISNTVSVKGAGRGLTLVLGAVQTSSAASNFSYTVNMSGMTLRQVLAFGNATVNLDDVEIAGSIAPDGVTGGLENAGAMTVTNSVIQRNVAGHFWGGAGGGVSNSGTLTLINCYISENISKKGVKVQRGNGGGIANSGIATIDRCTISNNAADVSGGGIFNSGQMVITNSTVSQNSAGLGGGILNTGTLTLNFVTLTDNFSDGHAGQIENSGTARIKSTIVLNTLYPTRQTSNCAGTLISDGYNIDNGISCGFGTTGDRSNVDPRLGPFVNNGGLSPTQALLSGSPAIDAGAPSGYPATDERGVARPVGALPDIGSYEGTITGSATITQPLVSPFVISPNGDGNNDTTTISFTLSAPDELLIDLLDRNGVVVRTLASGSFPGGPVSVNWSGISTRYDGITGGFADYTVNDGMYTYRIRGNRVSMFAGLLGVNNTIPEISKSWFLAEGSTVGFAAYILIQNPNDSPTKATITFFKQDGTTQTYSETIPPRTRTTIPIHREVPQTFSVSSRVQADLPIIVERSMYFNSGLAGSDTVGETSLSRSWYFAGNRVIAGDEDFILIVNPSNSPASIRAGFIYGNPGQGPLTIDYTVGANSRYTIPVHAIAQGGPISVQLTCGIPVAAERAFYFNGRSGGAANIGAVSPSLTWYFAEGETSSLSSSATFLEILNAEQSDSLVTVRYMLEEGTVIPKTYTVLALRRLTLNLTNEIGPDQRFSIEVVANSPVVVDRFMFSGNDVGDSVGSPTTSYIWNLAEGFTAFGFETWVLIANPGDQTANVTARFLLQNGSNVVRNYNLPPKRRLSIYVNEVPGIPPTSVSTQIISDQPVVVERTMKFANRSGIHQSIGVRQ